MKKEKYHILSGTILNVPNKNGRIYTEDGFMLAFDQFSEKIKNGKVYGQFGHPDNFETEPNKISHQISNVKIKHQKLPRKLKKLLKKQGLWNNRKQVFANIELIKNENLKIIREIGMKNFVVGSRTIGTLNADNTVQIDKIISYDLLHKKDAGF